LPHADLLITLNALLAAILGADDDPTAPWCEPFTPLTATRASDGAVTPARDHLLISGHIGGVNKDGALQLRGWLKALCHAAGPDRLPAGSDPGGATPCALQLPGEVAPVLYCHLLNSRQYCLFAFFSALACARLFF